MKRIVVGFDGSEHSRKALDWRPSGSGNEHPALNIQDWTIKDRASGINRPQMIWRVRRCPAPFESKPGG